jgi:hypothetical protein
MRSPCCLRVPPHIVDRQRLGKYVPAAANTYTNVEVFNSISNNFTVSRAARLSIKLNKVVHFKSLTSHVDFNLLKVIHYVFRHTGSSSGAFKIINYK